MVPLAYALLVAAATGFAFKNTRPIGILCMSIFCFLYPLIFTGLLAIALTCVVAYHFHRH